MIPSIFTKTGVAIKEPCVYHMVSQCSPPTPPSITAYPWGYTH